MKKRQITNNQLAAKIDSGFKGLQTQVRSQIEELARMTKHGFDSMQGESTSRFDRIEAGQRVLKNDVEDIKLRLGHHAPQFEVDDLKKRVVRLEKKAGLS